MSTVEVSGTAVKPTPPQAIRACGVMLGGSVVLNAAAAASIAALVRALVRGLRPHPLAIAGATALYATSVRSWLRHWGSTPAELRKPLPGDELVPEPGTETTRAVTIEAPVDQAWPWVAQIGQDRGGLYKRSLASVAHTLLLEIPHFIMERKMLLGIKARAERAFRDRGSI